MKTIKKHADKSFEEVLKELDDMILQDMIKFKELLNKLSIRENTDELFEQEIHLVEQFENPENITNLADNDLHNDPLTESNRERNSYV
jgi:hypothetical protein